MGSPDSPQLSVSETGFFFAEETVAIFDHGEASMEWLLGLFKSYESFDHDCSIETHVDLI